MSATQTTTTRSQPRAGSYPRGGVKRGGNRGRGKNQSAWSKGPPVKPQHAPVPPSEEVQTSGAVAEAAEESNEEDVCWICAEPVKYYSVSECNHRTCHICALRLRALYKKTDCTFCKEPQPSVVFSASPDVLFASYDLDSMEYKDARLSIFFETQDMLEETLLLLRFNCPDPECAYIGNGWGDLKLHVRATHGKLMCDLCIRSKRVFAHEHALYPPNLLPAHLPSMYNRSGKSVPKDQIEGGVHPLCEFCRECFFSDDELFAHMREHHEECFICKRNEVRDQYFHNYDSLEAHFNRTHYPCTQPACLVRKFVVFNTPLDLKAHMVEDHGGDMSSRDKRDARRINAEFEFEEVGGGGRHGRRDRNYRDREREPPPHQQQQQQQQRQQQQEHPPPAAPPVRPPGPGRRREGFGGSLTVEGGENPSSNSVTPQQSRPASPPRDDVDPAVAERHAMFMVRLQSLAPNPASAVPVVKAAIRGYRASESSAKDCILTVWNVLDQNLDHTASIVNGLVDIIDQDDKKQDLLASWKGFAIEQRREFPDLVPSTNNTGYAAIATGRVINAKHVTATRSRQGSSRQVWDRVAQAAASSSKNPIPKAAIERFPGLQSTFAPPTPAFRQPQRSTPWASNAPRQPAAASVGGPTPNQSITVVREDPRGPKQGLGRSTPQQPPKLSNALFPGLPTSGAGRQKAPVSGNVSLKNILGTAAQPAVSAWGSGGAENAGENVELESGGQGPASGAGTGGKGKKGKGKQKQTLFTLGSFPT